MRKASKSNKTKISCSFRDPSGFVFLDRNILYRQINFSYKDHYDYLINSGLYDLLVKQELLISHTERGLNQKLSSDAYKVIQPEFIPFISYPYEWCFSQLKDAALAILIIQKHALGFGMTLKDASAYNIQFLNGKPILIDTLSFEIYTEGRPWIAYKQFCQHFLAPLALMSYRNAHLSKLSQIYIDGIPLNLASSLLGWRSFLHPALYAHINLQANMQSLFKKTARHHSSYHLSKKRLMGLLDNLLSVVSSLQWKSRDAEWENYYEKTNYSAEAFEDKKKIIGFFLDKLQPVMVWDLGANTGVFSRIASVKGAETISFDIDPAAVEKSYIEVKKHQEKNILPLVLDITNPSHAIGWANKEISSLQERGPAQAIFVLAMIHHLVITNSIPFEYIAKFLGQVGTFLVIEFIHPEDSQVQRMISLSVKVFPGYTQEGFESAFRKYFSILDVKTIKDSKRVLYLMKKI